MVKFSKTVRLLPDPMQRTLHCALLLLAAVGIGVVRAEPVVVIGSFGSLENAMTAQQAAMGIPLDVEVRDVQLMRDQRDGRTLYRVGLIAMEASDAKALRQSARQNGFSGAWLATVDSEMPLLAEDPFQATQTPPESMPAVADRQQSKTPAKPLLPLYRDGMNTPKPAKRKRRWTSGDTSLTFRLKGFASSTDLPVTDLSHSALDGRREDGALDLRTMLQHDVGAWSFEVAHTALIQYDKSLSLGLAGTSGEQIVVSDDRRWVNLTDPLNDGRRHRTLHRLDRLNVQWRSDKWAVTVGRQAVSWGSGIVFQPLDPFNPFAPTAVDRDYKAGDDLVLVERLFDNGHDAQLLHVFRRNTQGSLSGEVASTAAKWHGYAGSVEFELIAAQHYDTEFFGVSGRIPVGPAVLRSDIAMRRGISQIGANDDWGLLGIVNIDVAFPWRGRTVYAYAEYLHNDFGLTELPSPLVSLPADLQAGLLRGEFFNLMRDYLAVGGSFEWHPLLTQQLTVIGNLHDNSSLVQVQFAYDVSQNQNMQLGWIGATGGSGDEFAPISVGLMPTTGDIVTQGGGDRVYLRWAGYF